MLNKRTRPTCTVFVIKHPQEVYLIRGSFFKRRILPPLDRNVARSSLPKLLARVAQRFVEPNTAPLKHGFHPHVIEDVEISSNQAKIDLYLVIIHAEKIHRIKADDQCIPLSEHLLLDSLLRKRILGTRIIQPA